MDYKSRYVKCYNTDANRDHGNMKERHCGSKWGRDGRGFQSGILWASPEGVMRSSVWRQAVDRAPGQKRKQPRHGQCAAHHEHSSTGQAGQKVGGTLRGRLLVDSGGPWASCSPELGPHSAKTAAIEHFHQGGNLIKKCSGWLELFGYKYNVSHKYKPICNLKVSSSYILKKVRRNRWN